MTTALQITAPSPAPIDMFGSALRIFDEIPEHFFDVITITKRDECPLLRHGEVAVYDTEEFRTTGLIDGEIYVYQSQRPYFGSWEAFYRLEGRHVHVDRWLVRIRKHPSHEGRWCLQRPRIPVRPSAKPASLDQMDEFNLFSQLIGRVVGLYRPNCTRES